MSNNHIISFPHTKNSIKENIIIKKLDDFINKLEITENILTKIDVQGYEREVISGGLETIKKSIILCITYDDFDISILKSNNYLIYKIDDLYPFKEIRNKNINNADMLIGPYQYLFNTEPIINMYSNINNTKNYNIGYSAVNDFYSDIEFNNNPIFKIFISGSVSEDIYPLRKYIKITCLLILW